MPETPEIPEELVLADEATASDEAVASAPEGVAPEAACVPEAAKEHDPMLDIHVPQATHTWKDFFIHVGTICVGLLIAVSLEQTVEYIHHSRELSRAREELREEKKANIEEFHQSSASFQASKLYLREYLATLHQSIKDPAVQLPALDVPIDFVFSEFTAWTAAQRGDGLALMPSDEQRANDRMYVGLRTLDEAENAAFISTRHAESVFLGGLDPHDLTPDQKKELYRDASLALVDIEHVLIVEKITAHFSPEFGDERSLHPDAGKPDSKSPGPGDR
jgi:hypothetical protein